MEETKTIVQTFLENENTPLIYDNDSLEQWNKLISELNLKGQNQVTGGKSPIPFMFMKKTLVKTFETLCPIKERVEYFNISTIPLKVLELIKLSKAENYFSYIDIWYDDIKPDPVCIGAIAERYADNNAVNPPNTRSKNEDKLTDEEKQTVVKWSYMSWNAKYYLIARWGDVKYSFSQLREMAITRFLNEQTMELKRKIKELNRNLEDIELTAQTEF